MGGFGEEVRVRAEVVVQIVGQGERPVAGDHVFDGVVLADFGEGLAVWRPDLGVVHGGDGVF